MRQQYNAFSFHSSKETENESMAVGQYSWNLPASTTRAEHVAGNRKRNGILSWNRKRGERGKEGGKEEGERGKEGGKEEGENG